MEKNINWHEIVYEPNDLTVPCKRWGHKTVYVEDQIVLFGGFSDVTYLNDLWAYNIHTNKWREIKTTGLRPQGKSNFTMHFDQVTNQLLIFGGGGPNKRRFNKISLLNWKSKEWTEVVYDTNDDSSIPWQRTYHSSEFKYPFLITFGGEGPGNIDLDDLWVFNIETRKWSQIKTNPHKTTNLESNKNHQKIEGRKFHSTVIIEEQFYVISGCKINYTCIPNIYSIDLKPLFEVLRQQNSNSQTISQINQLILEWKHHKIDQKENSLIEKWGHSTQTYNGKIYIFGGRNQQDYNDLIEFNPATNQIHKISPSAPHGKLPKSRRRHSSCMIGSSMLIFGGFNQDYFNDLQYISLFECRDTLSKEKYILQEREEMIELEERMFCHFMEQMEKDKPEYDIELFVQSTKYKEPITIRSVSSTLKNTSPYFLNCLAYNQSSNPERNNLTINLNSLGVGIASFKIFNNFLIKQLLILPKGYKLKKLCELLICADYFQVKTLFDLIQNILTLKVIDQNENLDDIFNIAANWNMQQLLKVCAQKKIMDRTYYNTYSRAICLSNNAARLKDKYVEQILMEIQFDEIQKGQKSRNKTKYQYFGKNIKQYNLVVEQKCLSSPATVKTRRKRSFVQKFVDSLSKLCHSGSTQEIKIKQKGSINSYESSDQQEMEENEIKIFY